MIQKEPYEPLAHIPESRDIPFGLEHIQLRERFPEVRDVILEAADVDSILLKSERIDDMLPVLPIGTSRIALSRLHVMDAERQQVVDEPVQLDVSITGIKDALREVLLHGTLIVIDKLLNDRKGKRPLVYECLGWLAVIINLYLLLAYGDELLLVISLQEELAVIRLPVKEHIHDVVERRTLLNRIIREWYTVDSVDNLNELLVCILVVGHLRVV